MLSDSLVQEALLRVTQWLLLELSCDLIPEFLDKTGPLFGGESPKSLHDLLDIHCDVTSYRDPTAYRG